jgi:predicted nucleic-acid-binding protein
MIGSMPGHFKITDKLGQGGMGVVYRAIDMRLNHQAAIKILPEIFAGDPERKARFEREARLLATLSHPNIARIYGLEEAEGKPFLVLELVETLWVLSAVYQLGSAQIAVAVDMLLNHQELTLQDADVVKAALRHYRKRPALGFSDYLVLEVARKAGHLPLGTFDRELGKREGTYKL